MLDYDKISHISEKNQSDVENAIPQNFNEYRKDYFLLIKKIEKITKTGFHEGRDAYDKFYELFQELNKKWKRSDYSNNELTDEIMKNLNEIKEELKKKERYWYLINYVRPTA